MSISAITGTPDPSETTPAAAGPTSTVTTVEGGASFASALDAQQRRGTLRDLLASMPPMIVEQVQKSAPGGKAPIGAVDALFRAIKSGEFTASAEQMAARTSLIATTARAAEAYGSAEEMWQGMREMLGAGAPVTDAVRLASSEARHQPAPALLTNPERVSDITTVLGGPLPAAQLGWWEIALRFLVDHSKATPAASTAPSTTTAPVETTPAATSTVVESEHVAITRAATPPASSTPASSATPATSAAPAAATSAARPTPAAPAKRPAAAKG